MKVRKTLLAAGVAVLAGVSGAVAVSSPANAAVSCDPINYSGRTAQGFCRGKASDLAIYHLHIQCQSVNVPVSTTLDTGNTPIGFPNSGTCSAGFVPSRINTHYIITQQM